jgi:hypothetical protein
MPADDNENRPREPKLHDDAPKRLTTQGAAAAETENGQRFSPGAHAQGSDHNGAPKRDTTPTGAVTVGAKALGFRPKSRSTMPRNHDHPVVNKPSLHDTIWESPLPKHHQHQEPPPLTPCRPHDPGEKPPPPQRHSPESQTRSFQGRRPGIQTRNHQPTAT